MISHVGSSADHYARADVHSAPDLNAILDFYAASYCGVVVDHAALADVRPGSDLRAVPYMRKSPNYTECTNVATRAD
jgi:hypothetical protein